MEDVRPLNLRLTRRALSHLRAIQAYIAQDKPLAAVKVGLRLRSTLDSLCLNPGMGHAGRKKSTLEWPVPGLPYVVVYKREKDVLVILGVYHGARKYRGD